MHEEVLWLHEIERDAHPNHLDSRTIPEPDGFDSTPVVNTVRAVAACLHNLWRDVAREILRGSLGVYRADMNPR